MTLPTRAKPYSISKREVYNAWLKIKANRGGPGIDEESLGQFESRLSRNLFKLWNRMSSGSYFPQAVKRVEIPKRDGKTRPLGIPTVYDRIAQEVVRARLEPELEKLFHDDSYGYRPGKSALEAVARCRERNWRYSWVVDIDIEKFFDTLSHELLLRAVRKHAKESWVVLYIERWLKAPIKYPDGRMENSERGTPQGGVVSPLLANLYLHYAFDSWMKRNYPHLPFERYADDIIIHSRTETEAQQVKEALNERFLDCGLRLHPEKTRIVYCKDSSHRGTYEAVSYVFLGYAFQPRRAKQHKTKRVFTGFLPAASIQAKKHLNQQLRALRPKQHLQWSLSDLASELNPILQGWFNYFSKFGRSTLQRICFEIDGLILRWIQRKHVTGIRRAITLLKRWRGANPTLFAHWRFTSIG